MDVREALSQHKEEMKIKIRSGRHNTIFLDGGKNCKFPAQAALQLVKSARGRLASSMTEVEANISIADRQRQRQGLSHMADILHKLQQNSALHSELK